MKDDDFTSHLAYLAVGGYYDYQQIRLGHMNRIRDLLRKKNEGLPFHKTEDKKKEEEQEQEEKKKFDKKYKDENLDELLAKMIEEKKIDEDEAEHVRMLREIAKKAYSIETDYKKVIQPWVSQQPVYLNFLKDIKGIGPVLSGGLLAMFDPRKAKHISSFWKYAGLAVDEDGKAPKLHKGQKPSFNPAARVLIYKVADSFIKHRTPHYRKIYDDEKEIQKKKHGTGEDHNCKAPKMHIVLRARRKMTKQFLADFWLAWRRSLNLPVDEPYSARFHEAKLQTK